MRHLEGLAAEEVVLYQELAQLRDRLALAARQRDMGLEPLSLRLDPGPHHRRFDLVAQMRQGRLLRHPGPDAAQLGAAAEMPHPREAQREPRRAHPGQRGVDVLELRAVRLPDEAQRQVEVLRGNPAGARQAPAEQAQLPAYVLGQGEGDEQAHPVRTPPRYAESSSFGRTRG